MTCDICLNNDVEIKKKCCGVKVCDMCDYKSFGLCYIHEREKINTESICDNCDKLCPSIATSGICEICEKNLCMECIGLYEFCLCICKDKNCLRKYWEKLSIETMGYDCDCTHCVLRKMKFIRDHCTQCEVSDEEEELEN
jgi:hypothetical protein